MNALPSAIRSGQKATSVFIPCAASRSSTSRVTPGYTVERSTKSWSSRRCGTSAATASGTACVSGFRCSSTGVPTTTITASALATSAGSVEARKSPASIICDKIAGASGSSKGIVLPLTKSTATGLMSKATTDMPARANAIANGRPTWPQPPTTQRLAIGIDLNCTPEPKPRPFIHMSQMRTSVGFSNVNVQGTSTTSAGISI